LHNCTVKSVKNVSFYRTGFQVRRISPAYVLMDHNWCSLYVGHQLSEPHHKCSGYWVGPHLKSQAKLVEIFTDLHATYKKIPGRMKAESFKQRVVSCFKAWEVGAAGRPI
jgi:hypothetical protein